MSRFIPILAFSFALLAGEAPAEWSLGDELDRVVGYSADSRVRMIRVDRAYRSGNGTLLRSAIPTDEGGHEPYLPRMSVDGELKPGQFMLAGEVYDPAVVEFVVRDGSFLTVEYALCDHPKAPGSEFLLEVSGGRESEQYRFKADERSWQSLRIELPESEKVRVRLAGRRLEDRRYNWSGLVIRGDGELAPLEEVEALSPVTDQLNDYQLPETVPEDAELKPSPHRVEVRPGYDALFYKDRPLLSYAAKGHKHDYLDLQARAGINTFYPEWHTFSEEYWPEGADRLTVGPGTPMIEHLIQCQRYGMVYKTGLSMAFCTPHLPAWLVEQEGLGYDGHVVRGAKAEPMKASIFKRKTIEYYKKGLAGFLDPLKDQPAMVVVDQEAVPSHLDDFAPEAQAAFRTWLRDRFDDDFASFRAYVGGIRACNGFDDIPYPKGYRGDPQQVGWPRRLGWLKLLWIQETYGDFLEEVFDFIRDVAPGLPVTQRYDGKAPSDVYASRRADADANYTFGHLTVEGLSPEGNKSSQAVGRKMWGGIHHNVALLPLPRGSSIGKTWNRRLRRGKITDQEWRINLFTCVANGVSIFEYSPFLTTWGARWAPAALGTYGDTLTPLGEISARQMEAFEAYTPYMEHYESLADVAVFQDSAFETRRFAGEYRSQSKGGLYTLIRETGYQADVVTLWEMTVENLRLKKALVLAGTISIAPEIQEAIREYVHGGGTLVAVYCADGNGFPGCNSYAYDGSLRGSALNRSFEEPPAEAHLGDVLGIHSAGKPVTREALVWEPYGKIGMAEYNRLVEEARWNDVPPCAEFVHTYGDVEVLATFADGSPAVFRHEFGKGQTYVFNFDIGQVAANLTWPPVWQAWCDILDQAGCRKALDTGNFYVEGGVWHNDAGERVVFLINHDAERSQSAVLQVGPEVELAPNECRALVMDADDN